MNSELTNMRRPFRLLVIWSFVYLIIILLFILGMYRIAGRIQTHTLPSGQIQLTIPYSKYLVGEAVTFTIKNNYNSPIYISNNCPSEPLEVYRQEDGKWVRQHDQASITDCRNEKRQVDVPANGVVNGSFAPWHNLFNQPGKYRVVAFVEYYNELPYQEFEVVAPVAQQPTPANPAAPVSSEETVSPAAPAPATTQNTSSPTVQKPRDNRLPPYTEPDDD